MFMKWIAAVIGGSLFLGICCISCVEYTPKPRGYVRIEPSKAQYKPLDLSYLPFNFDVSQTAVIEVPDQKKGVTGLNISYPELEAKLLLQLFANYSRVLGDGGNGKPLFRRPPDKVGESDIGESVFQPCRKRLWLVVSSGWRISFSHTIPVDR